MIQCSIILAAAVETQTAAGRSWFLQKAADRPMLAWVMDAAREAGSVRQMILTKESGSVIRDYLDHAEDAADAELWDGSDAASLLDSWESGTALVLFGDRPQLTGTTICAAYAAHEESRAAATVIAPVCGAGLSAENAEEICGIAAAYLFDIDALRRAVASACDSFAAAVCRLLQNGETAGVFAAVQEECFAVRDRILLSQADALLNRRMVRRLMQNGAIVLNPDTVRASYDARVGADTVIYPGTILEGKTEIGADCVIGPNTRLADATVGDRTEIQSSVVLSSKIGSDTAVGPFAYIRPGSVIGSGNKVGDFVEVKNATIGDGTKIAHLTYVGDADVGKRVNFGCGTVVVNYDGVKKHRTVIEDDCFIGCNSNLVSPVTVRKGAYTAAGSTITEEVPEDALAIARARQVNKDGWVKKNRRRDS